jgi:uncharacterized phage protein (TIGR01671 family)
MEHVEKLEYSPAYGGYVANGWILPEFVMEETGLRDKNGKDIYEGDILESPNDPSEPIRHVVEWSDKFCGWFARNVTDITPERRDWSIQLWVYKGSVQYGEFSVIGNKFEHPELLK